MKYPDARLLVLSKAPDPGLVKTRLIPVIGAAGAAKLYEDLLYSSLETAVNSALCPVDLWCSPGPEHPFFLSCRQRFGVELHEQSQGDLGRRMSHALESANSHSRPLVLIGADCPALSVDDLEEAFALLEQGTEVVLGPAEDGGYYLIGMRGLYPFVFHDVPWSTSTVLELTKTRLSSQRVKWQCLVSHRDLDTPEDYGAWLESSGKMQAEQA